MKQTEFGNKTFEKVFDLGEYIYKDEKYLRFNYNMKLILIVPMLIILAILKYI